MTEKQFADKREKLNFMPPALAEKQLTAPQKTDVENELENLGWPTAIFHDKWPGVSTATRKYSLLNYTVPVFSNKPKDRKER